MVEEPEAVRAFFDRFSAFEMELVDLICSLYPVDMITYHDDWGTERDTFFSNRMMEELVYEPTRKIVEHVREKGCLFQLHSCGNINRFIPYMIDMGIDFMQVQRRVVDLPAVKQQYGWQIGLNAYAPEGLESDEVFPREVYLKKIRQTVELLAEGGGYYTSIYPEEDPSQTWDGIYELYNRSREYYEEERRCASAEAQC